MAVHGEALVGRQFGNLRQSVLERFGRRGQQPLIDIGQQGQAARTMEGGEIVGLRGRLGQARAMLLKKGPPAGSRFQNPLHSTEEIVLVGKLGA